MIGHACDDMGTPIALDENYPEDYTTKFLRKPRKEWTELEHQLIIDAYDKYFKEPDRMDYDKVNPKHYRDASIEPIDVIESWNLGFHLGNAIKYIKRAGLKEDQTYEDDLKKCLWYIERAIKNGK